MLDKSLRYLYEVQEQIHETAVKKGWWEEKRNFGELIALCHSELSEALEWARKPTRQCSDHIPDFSGVEEELADCIIRILDLADGFDLDVIGALLAKMRFNEGRQYRPGKQF